MTDRIALIESRIDSLITDAIRAAHTIDPDFDRDTTPDIELICRIAFQTLRCATLDLNAALRRTDYTSDTLDNDPHFDFYYSDSTADELNNPAYLISNMTNALNMIDAPDLDAYISNFTESSNDIADYAFDIYSDDLDIDPDSITLTSLLDALTATLDRRAPREPFTSN